MFNKQLDYFKRQMLSVKDKMQSRNVEMIAKSIYFNMESLEDAFKDNTNEFKKLGYLISKSINPGVSGSWAYVGVVCHYAEEFKLDYKVYAGFCLPDNHHKLDEAKEDFEEQKKNGIEHPLVPNHMYVEIGENVYELYDNAFSGIEHIDCIEMEV